MIKSDLTTAQQIAHAAIAFEQKRTGHKPDAVTVVMSDNTLVITLHGALSPAEKTMAQSPAGAVQLQEYHRQLFNTAAATLRHLRSRSDGVDNHSRHHGALRMVQLLDQQGRYPRARLFRGVGVVPRRRSVSE